MKAELGATDQFFKYFSWLRNGFTITMISCFFPFGALLYGQVKIKYRNNV